MPPIQPNRLVHEAFRTPAGLDPQEAFEHNNAYAQHQAQAEQLDQRTNGVWWPVPYSAGLFTTHDPAIAWDVTRAGMISYRYRRNGPELHLKFLINGNFIGGSPVVLRIGLPENLMCKRGVQSDSVGWGSIPGLGFVMLIATAAGRPYIELLRTTFEPWTTGSTLRGQLVIEVE